MINGMDRSEPAIDERRRRDRELNEAARAETLRKDAARSLGENLEQTDALIKAAFELAAGLSAGRR